jgi:hypothetical protein
LAGVSNAASSTIGRAGGNENRGNAEIVEKRVLVSHDLGLFCHSLPWSFRVGLAEGGARSLIDEQNPPVRSALFPLPQVREFRRNQLI